MRPDVRNWLFDALDAAGKIRSMMEGKTVGSYLDDHILRAATERYFEIVGEALRRIARKEPEVAMCVREYRKIIDFRNTISHGYDHVDDVMVFELVRSKLGLLIEDIEKLLKTNS